VWELLERKVRKRDYVLIKGKYLFYFPQLPEKKKLPLSGGDNNVWG